jgi:hypothetical protein
VEVGLEAVRQAQGVLLRGMGVRRHVAGRVDDEPAAIAEVHDVGGIAEPFVDKGGDRDQRSLRMCRLAVLVWRSG